MASTQTSTSSGFDRLRTAPVEEVRARIRSGAYRGHTAGLGLGKLQCNLAILPAALADDFYEFCTANPKPCPLVGVSRPGDPALPALGPDIDIRTDVPGYNVYRHGDLDGRRTHLTGLWRDDFVAFALGCSFTFERALLDAGIPLRHIATNRTVAMYRTDMETTSAGRFGGGMVVSMRPVRETDIAAVKEISGRYPHAHGAPVHVGDPSAIGIGDLETPDWGDPVGIEPGEVPVFWACGVTPQNALARARPEICVTHTPGSMLITDLPDHIEPPKPSLKPNSREGM